MNKKNITPNPTQPVERIPTGQLPSALAELSEDPLSGLHIVPAGFIPGFCPSFVPPGVTCSYDGDDAE